MEEEEEKMKKKSVGGDGALVEDKAMAEDK